MGGTKVGARVRLAGAGLAQGDADEEQDETPAIPKWQEEQWKTARAIVSSDRFLPLPTQRDVHEWQIMKDFAYSVTEARSRELLDAIHGPGAFRFSGATIRRLKRGSSGGDRTIFYMSI